MADILISKFTTQIPRVGATPATPGFAESEGQDPTAPSGTPIQYGIGAGLSLDSLNQIQLGKTEPSYQLIDLKDFDISGVSSLIIGYDDSVFYEDFIYADKINDDLQKSLTLTSITGYKVNEAHFANAFNAEYFLNVRNGSSLNSYNLRFFTDASSSIASFEDNINSKGLEYASDYESNFTARSLVTKQYVDGAISGAGHNPVTIGSPANGLSISGTQVLTIGLASTSATGALSNTDWNTFNNKLNLNSPITGYTVGANTALADTDTILQAFGKVQGQINARISGTIASGQVAFGTASNTVGGDSGLTWNNTTKVFTAIGQQIFQGSTASDSPTLGTELATTGSGTNWTGSSFATGYTHTIGSTAPLTTSIPAVNATYYQIAYTITGRTTGSITINFGGTSTAGITATGATGPLTTSTANLEIVPTTDFNGTLVLSVRSIGTSSATTIFNNSSASTNSRVEVRLTNSTLNTLMGLNAGRRITTGVSNSFFGNNVGINNTTGSNNTFFGRDSGFNNNIGSSNSFFGVNSGLSNTSGLANSFFGIDSGRGNTIGISNAIFGFQAGFNNTTGSTNSFFGANAGRLIASGSPATIINNSVLIGSDTRPNADNETNQIVIGASAVGGGSNTTTIGNSSTVSTRLPAGQLWIGTTSGTNTLDVNGTTRIRTINNLGSAATSVLVPSATGVVSFRTLAEFASDAGLTNFWTLTGSDIFRNSAVAIGRTTIPAGNLLTLRQTTNDDTVTSLRCERLDGTLRFEVRNSYALFQQEVAISGLTAGVQALRVQQRTNDDTVASILAQNLAGNTRLEVRNSYSQFFHELVVNGLAESTQSFRVRNNNTNPIVVAQDNAGTTVFQVANSGMVTSRGLTITDAFNVVLGTTTGTRIGTATNQRLAFWNKTPIVQPTNAIGAGAFIANTSGIANDTATYGGYTMGQIAQALINVGVLA